MLRWKKLTRRQARLYQHTAIALGVGFLFALVTMLGQPFYSIQLRLSDLLLSSFSQPPSPNIVLVAIDDRTLREFDARATSQLPRSAHATVIEKISQAGARVIAFDILFENRSNLADDSALERAIKDAHYVKQTDGQEVAVPVPVVLALVGEEPPISKWPSEPVYAGMLFPLSSASDDSYPVDLRGASAALGHANMTPDGDGVMRRLPLIIKESPGQTYPALVLQAISLHLRSPLPEEYSSVVRGKVNLLEREIPVDASQTLRINYTGGPRTLPRLSYLDVINNQFDPQSVKGKIIFIGTTATAEPDAWVTPISPEKMFGVEIHANAADTILRERFLTEVSRGGSFGITLFLAVIAALLLPRLNLRLGGILTAGLLISYVVIALLTFGMRGYIFNLMYPTLGVPLVYVTALVLRVLGEQADKRQVSDLFGKYVSPDVASEIMKLSDAGQLKLGGGQQEVTVLFADMRGFTKISAQLGPEGIVSLLNKYLSVIIAQVLTNEGMVNKFAGDNIMGVWNVPQPDQNHAFLAVKAAWEAQQTIKKLREENPDLLMVQFGMGVNTGEAIAGNMGSEGRMEYTVIGDAVNLSSRLCGAAPGDEVWIGPLTYELVKEQVQVEALEPQTFKGKSEPVPVYKVTGIVNSP